MFINKAPNGRNNLCGAAVARLRKEMGISQRALADQLQLLGLDLDKNKVPACSKRTGGTFIRKSRLSRRGYLVS